MVVYHRLLTVRLLLYFVGSLHVLPTIFTLFTELLDLFKVRVVNGVWDSRLIK